MNSLSDSHAAIYEEPVDERIRKFLKLENYFLKLEYHKELDTPYDSYVSLYNLIAIYNTLSRVEVKSDLIREIDFHKQRYMEYIKFDSSDKIKLNSIMEKQNVILNNLYNLQSNYLNELNNDEFFQFCVKHYESASTELDYWLTRDHAIRLNQINLWLETVRPIENSVYFCLDILRKSSETKEVCADNGFYLVKLNQEQKIRLLRITMQSDNYFFPRISLGPQRATISFMLLNEDNKYKQIKDNITFVLDLCYI
tara:strand:- start:1171 stop:1932 length:762 start_codon:yes stop_codon:yes gene_type:complete